MSTRKGRGRWPLPKGWRHVLDEAGNVTYRHEGGAWVKGWSNGWDWWGPSKTVAAMGGAQTSFHVGIARTRAEAFRKAVGR